MTALISETPRREVVGSVGESVSPIATSLLTYNDADPDQFEQLPLSGRRIHSFSVYHATMFSAKQLTRPILVGLWGIRSGMQFESTRDGTAEPLWWVDLGLAQK